MVHTIYQERQFSTKTIKTSITRIKFYRRNGWELIGVPQRLGDVYKQKIRRPLVSLVL